jgi:hypothetical protein
VKNIAGLFLGTRRVTRGCKTKPVPEPVSTWVGCGCNIWVQNSTHARTCQVGNPRVTQTTNRIAIPTLDFQAPRNASTEVSNLSKGEMGFNFSLSISIQVSTIIHRLARGASSGGATCSLCLALYTIMFIELCFNFMYDFCVFLLSCGQLLSLCPASSLSCAILS